MQSGCAKGHEVSCKAPFHGVLRLFSLLGQSPVLHCGVFRCSEKRNFEKQINHLLCGWLRMLQLTV